LDYLALANYITITASKAPVAVFAGTFAQSLLSIA